MPHVSAIRLAAHIKELETKPPKAIEQRRPLLIFRPNISKIPLGRNGYRCRLSSQGWPLQVSAYVHVESRMIQSLFAIMTVALLNQTLADNVNGAIVLPMNNGT